MTQRALMAAGNGWQPSLQGLYHNLFTHTRHKAEQALSISVYFLKVTRIYSVKRLFLVLIPSSVPIDETAQGSNGMTCPHVMPPQPRSPCEYSVVGLRPRIGGT